ncbi:flagellar basal body rod protein FlgC [Aquicella lusitana]|jgi:flagellar basal-body rod protein FlgC|uniref:Flagellar basal-body rod protein FlgC n=1 Tax=Aquicella lusitana TaxID=254246 RepID=A0A370G9U6_9COXI|nr:flagellar basal body rod protein FlgC [Aquicella lusitana]RDI39956.1 flagellar basal-body rod protein FlgC [Aquicella lusitana]VVC74559.1 Flagellar basal-body rod protein FlgC [Aquicella lusitana]
MINSLDKVLTNASSGLSAQSIRMNTIASNLANAGNVGNSNETTYHKRYPIFSEVTSEIVGLNSDDQPVGGVRVTDIKSSTKQLERRYDPDNPVANEEGYVYLSDVNSIEEMTNMIAASKEYEANVEVINTTKNLITQAINVLKE